MRIFKTKTFHRWTEEVKLSDNDLKEAIKEIKNGLFEANLGGNIFKKRISSQGRGKRGGFRTIVAFKAKNNTFFIYGYAKNVKDNISEKEEEALKKLSKEYLKFDDVQLNKAVQEGRLVEVR